MTREAYVSFEVASLLKRKGFNEPCKSYFVDNVDYIDYFYSTEELTDLDMGIWETLRPTQQMACAWLREEYDLHIIAYPYKANDKKKWCCKIFEKYNSLGCEKYVNETLDSYEDAVEAALKYSLENLI